jgi:hypothetical protein
MALALAYPDGGQGGPGKSDPARMPLETSGVSHDRLKQARQVLRFSEELALAVRDGIQKLDEALATVKAAQQALHWLALAGRLGRYWLSPSG